ncbi:hypothetical protein AKJ09_10267 [Labilithrix luteola]|uniref:Uncharacterized protein n=1 Tax=Labilithrix luteola TaxID=1391654 RepID=A0A0K1QCX7_9BACT|nr:hypothetical protein [Labilithrix luteola]AKV03604.1 hypothetical protein AKJ09_10267 [Labilithrix luteola]
MHSAGQKLLAVVIVGTLASLGLAATFTLRAAKSDAPSRPLAREAMNERDDVDPSSKSARLLLSRPWFDRLPKSRTDEISFWVFFAGGIGFEDRGSRFRSTFDVFEFERQGSKFDLVFLQDKKRQLVPFEIVECHETPPFDLCLDLKEPLRGQKRLYSWDDDADMDAHVPWAREWRASAEVRAKSIQAAPSR